MVPPAGALISTEGVSTPVVARTTHDSRHSGNSALRVLSALCAVGLLVGAMWSIFSEQGLFLAYGAMLSVIATSPFWGKNYSVMSPWTLLALAIVLSCGIRGAILSLGWEGRFPLDRLWTLGVEPTFYSYPSFVYALALLTAVAGYQLPKAFNKGSPGSIEPDRAGRTHRTFGPWAIYVVYLFAAIGAVALIAYVQATGGFSLSSLSQKRTTIDSVQLTSTYQSHGALRFINQFSSVAFWVAIALRRSQVANRSQPGIFGFIEMGLLGLNAIALPFYASSRAEVVNILIVALAIRFLTGRGGIKVRNLVTLALITLVALSFMTYSRAQNQGAAQSALTATTVFTTIPEGIIYDRNFGDMSTTAQIIQRVPDQLPYAKGSTIATWLVAPIPRSVWPEKPLISAGPIIGTTVFGTDRSGVPPGYVAEFYWNFGLTGTLIGGALLGAILRFLESRFSLAWMFQEPVIAVLYSATAFRFGMFAISGGLGSSIYRLVGDLATTGLVLLLVQTRRQKSGRVKASSRG